MPGPDTAHGGQEDRPAPTGPRRNTSSSLRRALSIVMFLAEDRGHPRGATLTDLAEGLNLSKSTILRLLAPLREVRLVDQDADSGRYRLGPQNALLGQVYLERLDFRETAAPHLHELVESIGETVHLVVFDPPEIVYIDKVESPQPVRMHSRIGSRQPAYCTAVGKAFLAHASDAVVEQVIARGMPPAPRPPSPPPSGCTPNWPPSGSGGTRSTTWRTRRRSAASRRRSSITAGRSPRRSASPGPPPASPGTASPRSGSSSSTPRRPCPGAWAGHCRPLPPCRPG
ncbi:hypothetical protein SVIO_088980 [Streptomyces violaceusniger]|uniref:HTH iclR-type domain-containing protein n=1 Tax=Streptomyces violaceusniger TaxID=68280 RepID=A0A4D4LAX9_STRVO|nr:hypothetical protein SVIO_088980 [Streptomyces violaceusniger]